MTICRLVADLKSARADHSALFANGLPVDQTACQDVNDRIGAASTALETALILAGKATPLDTLLMGSDALIELAS